MSRSGMNEPARYISVIIGAITVTVPADSEPGRAIAEAALEALSAPDHELHYRVAEERA